MIGDDDEERETTTWNRLDEDEDDEIMTNAYAVWLIMTAIPIMWAYIRSL
jgi:hypothetical protein